MLGSGSGYGYVPPTPIGSGNERGNAGVRVTQCPAHGGHERHVDMTVPIKGIGAHKIRVSDKGEIITDELT